MATKGAGNLVDSRMSFVMRLMSVLSDRKGRWLRAEMSQRAASNGLVACPMWLYLIPFVESPRGYYYCYCFYYYYYCYCYCYYY
jgi:hypothetical protein